jgi:hypothetical protein
MYTPHRPMEHPFLALANVPFLSTGLVLAFQERKIKLSVMWLKLAAQ